MTNDRQQRAVRAEQMRKDRERADRRQRNLITVGIVAVVVVLIGLAAFAYNSARDARQAATALTTPRNVTDDYGIVYSPEVATGEKPSTAPVVVTLYEDFLCPGCGALEQISGPFLDQAVEAGEITIDYRPFAFLLTQSSNEYSQRAWNIAACAVDEGGVAGFKKLHALLFANQPPEGGPGPEDPELLELAEQAGVTGIDECVDTRKFTPWVEAALAHGRDAGVTGTPTLMIDGTKVEGEGRGIPQPADIRKAIDAAKS